MMQGAPGPPGLKGSRGESGPSVSTEHNSFTLNQHLLNYIMLSVNHCHAPYTCYILLFFFSTRDYVGSQVHKDLRESQEKL